MIRLTRGAERQVNALLRHYAKRSRPEAGRSLLEALDNAAEGLEAETALQLPAPRPYPSLARPGRLWTKSGRYWIAYRPSKPPVILAVFFEQADIPGRL